MAKGRRKGKGVAGSSSGDEAVKVVVRCRPMSSGEVSDGREQTVDVDETRASVTVRKPDAGAPPKKFSFDHTYGPSSTQMQIFEETARPIIEAALAGYNGTIFAYGQTGTGKTFTMEGVYDDNNLRGIIPNSFHHIFQHIEADSADGAKQRQYLVTASYLEIYNEEIRDLLAKSYKTKLAIKEHPDKGVYVKDLSAFVVKDVAEINKVMAAGKKNRSVGATKMNVDSSRSHSVFTITIECSQLGVDGAQHIHVGRLNLVDLAGSERQSKTHAEGARFTEAVNINLSLSALGNVISALAEGATTGARHIPYRDSKLTRLLQDSLGGNSKTVMIAAIGPADYNYDETISTLRYANRAKNIKNKPVINEDPKDAMLRQFQEEIERLKSQLQAVQGDGPPPEGSSNKFDGMDDAAIAEMEAKLADERARMEADASMAAEEKEKLAKKLAKREAEIADERAARDALAAQISALEEKVIVGGTNLLDEVEKQELELKQAELEMERKAKEAARLKAMMEEKEEETELEAQKFNNLQEEVDVKTQKLKRLWAKFQAARAEIADLNDEHTADRESLVTEINRQANELKLCRLIVSYFIPEDEIDYIRSACVFDSEANDYVVKHVTYTGNNIERAAMLNGGFAPGDPPSASLDAAAASPTRFEPGKLQEYESALHDAAIAPGDYNTGAENEAPMDVLEAVPNVYLSYSPQRDSAAGAGYGFGAASTNVPSSAAGTGKAGGSATSSSSGKTGKGKSKAKSKDKAKSKAKAKAKDKDKGKGKGKGKGDAELYPESRGFVVRR